MTLMNNANGLTSLPMRYAAYRSMMQINPDFGTTIGQEGR